MGPHVVTIEDPVEYELCCASQTEINGEAGFGYGEALRSVLRQGSFGGTAKAVCPTSRGFMR